MRLRIPTRWRKDIRVQLFRWIGKHIVYLTNLVSGEDRNGCMNRCRRALALLDTRPMEDLIFLE